MKNSHLVRKIGVIIVAAMMSLVFIGGDLAWADNNNTTTGGTDGGSVKLDPEKENQCATILRDWCDEAENDGEKTLMDMIKFTITILSVGIGVLATIGLIVCGYLIMSARDNEAQVQKAKKRMLEIVIGIVLWALGALVLLLIIPDSEAAEHVHDGAESSSVQVKGQEKEIG